MEERKRQEELKRLQKEEVAFMPPEPFNACCPIADDVLPGLLDKLSTKMKP